MPVQVVRMTGEEMSFRPVPLAGDLESTSPAVLASAPQTRQTGAFHAFEAAGGPGQRWVVSCSLRRLWGFDSRTHHRPWTSSVHPCFWLYGSLTQPSMHHLALF